MRRLIEKLRSCYRHLPPGASEEELREFEEELGRPLPRALRALYLDHNGEPKNGRLRYRLLPLYDCLCKAEDEWRFWALVEEEGAVYRFSDGTVHSEVLDEHFLSVQSFLTFLLENAAPESEPDPFVPAEVRRLFEDADEFDEVTRLARIKEALKVVSPQCGFLVLRYLDDEDEEVQVAVCQWIARVKHDEALELLASKTCSVSPKVRLAARQAVRDLGGELFEFCADTPLPLPVEIVLAFQELGYAEPPLPPAEFTLMRRAGQNKFQVVSSRWRTPGAENFPDLIRERMALYFAAPDAMGAHNLAVELVANGVDQFLAGAATKITVRHDEWTMEVQDDGEGYPLHSDLGEQYLTQTHDRPTGDGHAPHIHLTTRGVGLAPVNAVCEEFLVESVREDRRFRLRFCKGERVEKSEPLSLPFERGTRVKVRLDREIWQEGFPKGWLRRRLFDLVHLVPGLRMSLNDEVFYAPNGLMDLAEFELDGQPNRRFGFQGQSDFLHLNVAFVGETRGRPKTRSWVNGAETPRHGSHVEGALAALEHAGWRPAQVLVHVIMREPQFAGPVRNQLTVDRVERQVLGLLREPLRSYLGP